MGRYINIFKLLLLLVPILYTQVFSKTSEISLVNTTLPDTIFVEKGEVDGYWRDAVRNIPLQEYIRGVVRSEMGLMKKDDNYAATIAEAYKAQAIAASTNLKERVRNQTTGVSVPNSAAEFQTYLSATSFANYPKTAAVIEGVVDAGTAKTIVTYNSSVASIRYFHGTKSGFTLNSNECVSNGRWYNPYMSRQVTPEKLQNEYPKEVNYSTHAADGCGMSQVGAVQLALMGRNYEGILKYYYGTMPPYVKSVAVTQDGDGNFKYKAAIADNVTDIFGAKDKNSTTRKWDPKEEGAIGSASETKIEIAFSDIVTAPTLTLDGHPITTGIETKYTRRKDAPVDKWTYTLPAKELVNLSSGDHFFKICATHAGSGEKLDSNPKTMAYKGYLTSSIAANYETNAEGCDDRTFKITVNKGKPYITVASENPGYSEFAGVSALTPSTLETAHTITCGDGVVGISSVTVDGPSGSLTALSFDPPVPSTSVSYANMPPGPYSVKAVNAVGEETITPFNIGSFNVRISTPTSSQSIAYSADPLGPSTVNIVIRTEVESNNELDRIELTDTLGRVLETKPLSGSSSTVSFSLSPLSLPEPLFLGTPPAGYTPSLSYALKVWDKKGNYKRDFFTLALDNISKHLDGFPQITGSGSARGAIVDLQNYKSSPMDAYAQLPGTLVSDYYIQVDTSGIRKVDTGLSGYAEFEGAGPGGITTRQHLGNVTVKVRTGDTPDLSDVAESVILSGPIYESTTTMEGGFWVGFGWLDAPPPSKVRAKRYIQTEVAFEKASPSAFVVAQCTAPVYSCLPPPDENTCRVVYCNGGFTPGKVTFNNYMTWAGMLAATQIYPENDYNVVDIGDNVRADLAGGGARVDFEKVMIAGKLSATAITSRPPNGYLGSPANITYRIISSTGLAFSGTTRLSLKYDPVNLTSAQESAIKLVRVLDPAAGKYEELETTVDTVNKNVFANVTSFSDFIVAVPAFANPQKITSANTIGGYPELEFMSGMNIAQSAYDMSSPGGQGVLAGLKMFDKLPITNVYSLIGSTTAPEQTAAIKMRYSPESLATLGLGADSLAIYAFSESGDIVKLSDQTLDKDNKMLTAKTRSAEFPLYAVLVSSVQLENIENALDPDITGPTVSISYNGVVLSALDGVVITTNTLISLSAIDPIIEGARTSGLDHINYVIDPASDTVLASTYTGPLKLPEGVHVLDYNAVDKALNDGALAGTTVYVDATPPVTELYGSDMLLSPGSSFYATITGTITLTAADPLVNGARSGVSNTLYLLEKNFSECLNLAQFLANPSGQLPVFYGQLGTCENPLYTAPFILSPGTHTVQYLSFDNVGNMESPKTFHLEVVSEDTALPEVFLIIDGSTIAAGGSAEIMPGTQITLSALDPETNGTASGIKAIYYLVNATTASCQGQPDMFESPGTCRNPLYAGPFTLEAGPHTVYYTAEDNAGNTAEGKSASINVFSFGFKGSAPLADSLLWTWNLKAAATAYQVFSATGVPISPILVAGTSSYIQANLTPNTEYSALVRAYSTSGSGESAVASAVTLADTPKVIEVFSIGQNASLVIGSGGTAPDKLRTPRALAFDRAGGLWVADSSNYRVLRFAPPLYSGMSASLVIGQADLYSRTYNPPLNAAQVGSAYGIAIDPTGALWVNNGERLLRFSPPFINSMSADLVIGDNNFTFNFETGCAQNKLRGGMGKINFDQSGALWVPDSGGARVLRFTPPFTTGMNADLVIGQPFFTTCTGASQPTAASLPYPMDIEFDAGGVAWVSDQGNDRVLGYAPPFYNGMAASKVLGQSNFVVNNSITGLTQPTAASLSSPDGLEADAYGGLWVADRRNSRVLKYRPPLSSGMAATLVLGQNDFVSNYNFNPLASFINPVEIGAAGFMASDSSGRLWVADTSNHSVRMFEPIRSGMFSGVGSSSFTINWLAGGNPSDTAYYAEISLLADFSSGVIASGRISGSSFSFTGLSSGTRYHVRLSAVNRVEERTGWVILGSVLTQLTPITDFTAMAQPGGALEWAWSASPGITTQLFNSTGVAISGLLPEGTTRYVLSGLIANTAYTGFIRSMNASGSADSPLYTAVTQANPPSALPFSEISFSSVSVNWSAVGNPAGTEYKVELYLDEVFAALQAESPWAAGNSFTFEGLACGTIYFARVKARNAAGLDTSYLNLGAFRTLDILPPVTELVFSGPKFGTEPIFISSLTVLSLNASDDAAVEGDGLGNMATSRYSVDSDTFSVYYGSFSIVDAGAHVVRYFTADASGNIEAVKSSSLTVDNAPPDVSLEVKGSVLKSGGVTYISLTSTVALHAADSDAGVRELRYEFDGAAYVVAAASATLQLEEGPHDLAYSAVDNVGNISPIRNIEVIAGNLPSINLVPVERTATSLLWRWDLLEGVTGYQVFSSTGGAVSGVLSAATSEYLQAGLAPNVRYSIYLRVYGETNLESTLSEAVTLANSPEVIEVFNFGQGASIVIGQPNFSTTSGGTAPNKLFYPRGLTFDKSGNLWVSDRYNNRVLRFSKPFFSNMPADLVLGQKDFYSREDIPIWIASYAFQYPSGLDFDTDGNLWVSDQLGRILRFAPPFTNKMAASMAIGVDSIGSTLGRACAQNRLDLGSWGDMTFDKKGGMWVADFSHNRVMRFSPPFSTGMNADMVIGQPNFTSCSPGSYPYIPTDKNLSSPLAVKSDSKGNIWVADYGFNRVVKYAQPFYMGMSASTVLGQKSLFEKNVYGMYSPSSTSLNGPAGLEFDGQDNLYVVDARDNRVLKYRPPFSNSMPAGLVIGQNDFNSVFNMNLQATFNFPMGVETSGFTATDENGRLWVADVYGSRVLMFEPVRSGIFTGIGFSSFTVSWLANNNSENTLYFVEISPYDDFSSQVSASGYVNQNSYVFTNLPQNSSYYVRVKAKNLEGLETAYKTLGFVKTKENTEVVSVSTETINGNPEAVFTAYQPSGIVLLSTTSATGAVVLAKASEGGLTLASNLYEIGPEGTYAPPASITFYYSAERLAGLGLQAGDIAVYEHFADLGWVRLPDQSLDTLNNRITVPVTRIASVFGIFGIVKDRLPPVTAFSVVGSSWSAESLYVSMRSSVSLSAFDPVVYGTSTGVAFTEFSTDMSTPTFSRYLSPFVLPGGYQRIEFRSSDNAGNMEGTKSKSLIVDATPPLSEVLLAGTTGQNSWYVSPVDVIFVSTDSLSGAGGLYYSFNGSSFAVYASSFPVSAEGRHILRFYSVDNVLNTENINTTVFSIDNSTPAVSSYRNPIPNLAGWNNTPVEVVFAGTDTVSGIEYCSSSFTIASEGLQIPVSGYCTDYASWTSTISFSVNIDTTAPYSNVEMAAEQGLNGWLLSKVGVTLTSTDSLSGTAGLYYSVDGSSFALYSSSFSVNDEGEHLLKYYSVDRAGNKEIEKELVLKLDLTHPLVEAVSGPDANIYGWNNTAISVVFNGTDTISGLAYCEPAKTVGAEGSSQTISGYCSDYAGWSSTATLNISIDTTAPVMDYLLSPPANAGDWNSGPVNVLFRGSDTLSGIVECSSIAVAGEGKDQKVTGWCRDLAGNITYTTATLNIDLTWPLVSAEQAPARNATGWNNGPVEVNFTGSDALSGIAYCEPVKTASLAGASQTVTGYCMDYAGLSSTVTYIISIDTAAPLLAYSITPANNYGWNNSDVTISFDCSDDLSGIAGCPGPITYPAEGINISTSVRAWDLAGNYKDSTVSDINIDKTAPASTAAVSGIYRNGWYSSTVEIVLGSTDALSGVKEIYYSLDGGDYVGYKQSLSVNSYGPHEVKYYAVDKAGNIEAIGKAGFKIDLQAPVISHILNPEFNAAGWNNSAVSVVFTGTDSVSGVEECSSGNITLEGAGQEIAGWCRDLAGNISYATATINLDFTIPLVSALQIPERNSYGWNNTPVTAVFSGTDAVSGIAYCSSNAVLETEGSSRTMSGYCADHAGWSSSTASLTVNIDTTAPGLTYIANPAANEADWNNSNVVLEFTCADSLSGVRTCPAAIPLSGEGVDISTSVAAYDYAGNLKDILVRGINIDKTQPISTATLLGTYRNGWYSSVVSAVLSSTDTLSGVKRILYRLESLEGTSEEKVYTDPLEFTTDGRFKLYYAAEDAAGNREVERDIEFNVDATAPLVKHTLFPVPNSKDWNNTAAQVVFSGTDTTSGIESCSSETVRVEGSAQKIAGWCRDLAGNIGYYTATVNIDLTSPVVSVSSPAAGQIFVATRGRIYIGFGVQDNLDPTPGLGAFLVQTEDRGSPRGIRPAVIAVTNGQSIEPLDIDDGIWRLAVSATDFADNTSTLSGGTFEVVHDVLAPRTGQAVAGGVSLTGGVTTYITGETVLKFSSVDDLVLAEDGIGLGVRKQTIKVKTSGSIVKELAFENLEPKQGAVFNSTFTLAATSSLADGLYSLSYYAEDILGNIEGEKTFILGLDNASPVTAAELSGTPGESGWYISAVSVKLTANDALSGVAEIHYQSEFNGQRSELMSYTGPFTLSVEGLYNVYFYAKDRLGNTEAEKAIAFKIDRTDPLISAERTPLANTYGWSNTAVTVNYLCTDGLSGVNSCSSATVLAGEGINQSAFGEAKDNAGNSSSVTISGINIDKTGPVSAYSVEGIVHNRDGKTYLSPASKLSLNAADPVSGGAASGIDIVEYYIDSAPFLLYASSFSLNEGIRSVYYRSRDKAGNEETGKSVELHIDGTSPVTSFNISGTPYIVDGTHYINSPSAISFAVTDPLVEGVASGSLITKYRLDGGSWQVYAASITIPAEGLHKLEYYSLDNVQNAESLRTLNIIIDNTAPVATLNVGEPMFEVFGLKIITPETPVTLSAADPETAGPASGVKSIYYELTDAAGLGSGVRNYTEPFSTGREGVFTVSYWSADNAGNSGTPLEAKLRVSSLRSDALDAVDGLEMTGSADIAGTVRSNATVSLTGNARILGDVYASTISLSGKAQLTGQQHSGAATLVPTPLYIPEIVEIASNTNNNSLIPAKYLVNGKLVVPAKDELTLSTGVYYFNGIDLGGGARVGVNGKVDILVAGDISINGGASLNAAGSSSRLNIFLSTGSALTFTGGGSLAAYVYAPYSQLKLAGNALLGGHYFVKRAVLSGAGNILQAGETLPVAAAPPGGGPKTKAAAMPSGSFGILAGPDPAFRLGEVYVFPNPAKGGEAPVFHIETGIADTVKITIYTISGRAAHEHALTGMPAELDDGNGLSYAYEYTWRGHIPSGVYLYYIETQKAGQKLKKTGKFSVVR